MKKAKEMQGIETREKEVKVSLAVGVMSPSIKDSIRKILKLKTHSAK